MQKGFTLLETMMVISLTMLLAGIGYAVSISFLRSQALVNTTQVIASQIILTQTESYMQNMDELHGVKIFSDRIVHFIGNDYASRDTIHDNVIPNFSPVILTGDSEIVFSPATLAPVSSFDLTLELDDNQYQITVSSYGILEITKGNP